MIVICIFNIPVYYNINQGKVNSFKEVKIMDQVGYFRWKLPPKSTMMIYSITSYYYNLEMIFFDGNGVDMENELIHGFVLRENKFIKITTQIPKIINNTPYHRGNKILHKFLSEKSHFMFKGFGGKNKEYRHFKKEGTLKDILIPSSRVKDMTHVVDFIDENEKVILKPLYSDKGKGIFRIEKIAKEIYLIENKDDKKTIYKNDFQDFYDQYFSQEKLLISKFIKSKTRSNHPFDIRINFEKDKRGEWKIDKQYARIVFIDNVTSSLAAGGGIAELRTVL